VTINVSHAIKFANWIATNDLLNIFFCYMIDPKINSEIMSPWFCDRLIEWLRVIFTIMNET
jgi:hypothetical protein